MTEFSFQSKWFHLCFIKWNAAAVVVKANHAGRGLWFRYNSMRAVWHAKVYTFQRFGVNSLQTADTAWVVPGRFQFQMHSLSLSLSRVERCSLALTLSLRYWKPAAERLPEVCVCQDHPLPPIKPHSLFKESIINNKRYFTGACLSCTLSLSPSCPFWVLYPSFFHSVTIPNRLCIPPSLHPAFSPHAGFSQVTLLHSRRGQWYDCIVLDTQSSRKIPTLALMMLQGNSVPSTSVTWSAQACVCVCVYCELVHRSSIRLLWCSVRLNSTIMLGATPNGSSGKRPGSSGCPPPVP